MLTNTLTRRRTRRAHQARAAAEAAYYAAVANWLVEPTSAAVADLDDAYAELCAVWNEHQLAGQAPARHPGDPLHTAAAA